MPIYEFKCESCGNIKEELLSIKEANSINEGTTIKCSVCGNSMLHVLSNCTFHLKGTGWYTTDYKPNNTKNTHG